MDYIRLTKILQTSKEMRSRGRVQQSHLAFVSLNLINYQLFSGICRLKVLSGTNGCTCTFIMLILDDVFSPRYWQRQLAKVNFGGLLL